MRCPKCKSPTSVIDSRPQSLAVKRRRKCDSLFTDCNYRFNTLEMVEQSMGNTIVPTVAKVKPKQKRKRLPFNDPIYLESLTDDELEALITGDN